MAGPARRTGESGRRDTVRAKMRDGFLLVLVLALGAAPPIAAADDLAARYRGLSQRVMVRALAHEGAWRKLEHVTTRIGLHLNTTGEHYFDWHHSHGDTLDKVEPADLQRATFMLALMGYVLADMPGRLAP